jgi:ribose transport system substrate-binding protein
MTIDYDDRYGINRRHALHRMISIGAASVLAVSVDLAKSLNLLASAGAQALPTVPIIVRDKTSLFGQIVLAGARKAGQDIGVNVLELGPDSESNVDGQIGILENVMRSSPAAIVIAPARSIALQKAIAGARRKVKIIGIDSAADPNSFISTVRTDNVAVGRLAADAVATAIQRTYADAEGDVAMITASSGVTSLDQGAQGFKQQIATKYGALAIVAESVGDGQVASGFNMMMSIIEAHSDLRGVFASNSAMARGAAQALAEKKGNKLGEKINLIGFGFDDRLVQMVRDGTVAGLIVQDPFQMGYDSIRIAVAASRGEHVPTNIDTGIYLVTKANIDATRSQELLSPWHLSCNQSKYQLRPHARAAQAEDKLSGLLDVRAPACPRAPAAS